MIASAAPSNWRRRAPAAAVFIALGLLTLALADERSAPAIPKEFPKKHAARVVSVASPTVLRIERNGMVESIAIRGITVPGPVDSLARAEQFLTQLLIEETVYLDFAAPRDPADATAPAAAIVYRAPDGLIVNLEMVRQGYAAVSNESGNRYQKLMEDYERRARDARKGIWSSIATPPVRPTPTPGQPATLPATQPAPAASQPTATAPAIDVVFVTPSGKKYHLGTCKHAQGAKAIPLSEARERHFAPCAICKPPQ